MKTEIEQLKKENAELQAKVLYYEGLPSAKFYQSLMQGVDYLREQNDTKELDFENDPFAKSILQLSEKSDKIFAAIEKGINSFVLEDAKEDSVKAKKLSKHEGVGI
jgi:hypothetical protein